MKPSSRWSSPPVGSGFKTSRSGRHLLSGACGRVLNIDERKARRDTLCRDASNSGKLDRLEEIGRLFLRGYNAAVRGEGPAEIRERARAFETPLRGFVIEGGAMGTAVLDTFRGKNPHLPSYLVEFERDYTYLAYVGVGWALGRLPWRSRRLMPMLDPLLGWLAYDGVGFHDTYFNPERSRRGWHRFHSGYAVRAYDQGVGRALWFVTGGSIDGSVAVIQSFDPARAGDVWSGLGLAMTYAGAADPVEVGRVAEAAGAHRGAFHQGIAFACEAFHHAGSIPTHAERAAEALGSTAADLVTLVRHCRAQLPPEDGSIPRYEMWRASVGAALA